MKVKNFLFVVLVGVFLLAIHVGTDAGFHGTGLICNKCHTIHYSEDGGTLPEWDAGGPFSHLLIKEHSTELCLTCHNGDYTTAPDVLGEADARGLTERAAGFFREAGGDVVDIVNPNGHNLAPDKASMSSCLGCHHSSNGWDDVDGGGIPYYAIGCLNCHDPHGRDINPDYDSNYRYRNLRWASDPGGEPIIKAFMTGTGTAIYEQGNIGYADPDPETSGWLGVTTVCFDCHHGFTRYSQTRESGAEYGICVRHPNTCAEFDTWEPINKHTGGTDPAHWVDGIGIGFVGLDRLPFAVSGVFAGGPGTAGPNYADATAVDVDNEVICLTCHKAHGWSNSSSLRWDYKENGSNLGCQQCHNKGAASP